MPTRNAAFLVLSATSQCPCWTEAASDAASDAASIIALGSYLYAEEGLRTGQFLGPTEAAPEAGPLDTIVNFKFPYCCVVHDNSGNKVLVDVASLPTKPETSGKELGNHVWDCIQNQIQGKGFLCAPGDFWIVPKNLVLPHLEDAILPLPEYNLKYLRAGNYDGNMKDFRSNAPTSATVVFELWFKPTFERLQFKVYPREQEQGGSKDYVIVDDSIFLTPTYNTTNEQIANKLREELKNKGHMTDYVRFIGSEDGRNQVYRSIHDLQKSNGTFLTDCRTIWRNPFGPIPIAIRV